MPLSRESLVNEADRLVARAERKVKRFRSNLDTKHALQAEQQVKRLHLYRAILRSDNSAQALMPEYVFARGFAPRSGDAGPRR
jgi:hypothetical protein